MLAVFRWLCSSDHVINLNSWIIIIYIYIMKIYEQFVITWTVKDVKSRYKVDNVVKITFTFSKYCCFQGSWNKKEIKLNLFKVVITWSRRSGRSFQPRPAETDFTLRLHMEIKFCPGKVGQFSIWYLIRFACIFFGFFFVRMSFYETEDS